MEAFKASLLQSTEQKLARITEFYEKKLDLIMQGAPEVFDEGKESISDCLLITIMVPDEAKKLDSQFVPPEEFDGKLTKISKGLQNMMEEADKTFKEHALPLMQLKPLFGGSTRVMESLEAIGKNHLQ